MMEIDKLAADRHSLGTFSIIEILFERAEIERVVGNQHNKLLRQQQGSKSLSASEGTTKEDRGKEKKKIPPTQCEGNCFF